MKNHELWRKLMRVAECHGSAGFDDSTSHFHLGVNFEVAKNVNKDSSAESYLKIMVCYQQERAGKSEEDAIQVDEAAWIALCNFEEIRTVGKPSFALTTTYNGWCGLRSEGFAEYKAQDTFKTWLIEFQE
jgi:hypothetical protein